VKKREYMLPLSKKHKAEENGDALIWRRGKRWQNTHMAMQNIKGKAH
jgi:hypothetical protein